MNIMVKHLPKKDLRKLNEIQKALRYARLTDICGYWYYGPNLRKIYEQFTAHKLEVPDRENHPFSDFRETSKVQPEYLKYTHRIWNNCLREHVQEILIGTPY